MPDRPVPRNASISGRAISASKGFPAPKAPNHRNRNKARPASPHGPANPHEATAFHLDPWLAIALLPQGEPLAALVRFIMASIPKLISSNSEASERRSDIVATIIGNFLCTQPPLIAVPQGQLKATRYSRLAITGRQLKPTLDLLEAAGLIDRTPAVFKRRRTIIAPTARLVELMTEHEVAPASISRLPDAEVIILKHRKARTVGDNGAGEPFTLNNQDGPLIDYPDDCQEANALRKDLRSYNEFLSWFDIRVIGSAHQPSSPLPPFKPFVRIFASSGPVQFNLHGRLYAGQVGGWHQGLPKSERHLLRINGEKIAELDWQSLHLHLAYVEAQCTPTAGDLYAVHPELEAHRSGVKVAASAMLSISGELLKLPPSVREACPTLPKQWTARRIASAVKAHHPAIAHLFGKDRGIAYMHKDSTLLMMVLTRLMDRGLPALPLHDAILVQESVRDIAIATMQEASMELLGVELPVTVRNY